MKNQQKRLLDWDQATALTKTIVCSMQSIRVYEYLRQDMYMESVMLVLEIVEHLNIRQRLKHYKCEEKSKQFERNAGTAIKDSQYNDALKCYNSALVHAPENSEAMKLAYKGRSALFARFCLFSVSLNNLNTYFSMETTDKIGDDLKNRKRDYESLLLLQKVSSSNTNPEFVNDFFKLNKRHPLIPCASTDLDVVMEDSQKPQPTIVAANDIKVGTVLAVEKAFTAGMCERDGVVTCCYYCQRMTLSLIPCNTCCVALFCNEECKNKCLKEYHNIECQIIAIFDGVPDDKLVMAIRTTIKIRNMCKNWGEFIECSKKVEDIPNRYGSLTELYDRNNKISLLLTSYDDDFRVGAAFNSTISIALFLNCVREIPHYFTFTNFNEELAVKKAITNIMMSLMLFQKSPDINYAYKSMICELGITEGFSQWFSFIGKIKHDCNPNAVIVGLNKEAAVVALRPIEKGSPLTISYIDMWSLEKANDKQKALKMYLKLKRVCSCQLCTEELPVITLQHDQLSKEQKQFLKNYIYFDFKSINLNDFSTKFKIICQALTLFKNYPSSSIYRDYLIFFQKYMFFMKCVLDNLDDNQLNLY